MTHQEAFHAAHPSAYWLAAEDLAGLTAYLRQRGWLAAGETIQSADKAGEGNMNYTLRVRTGARAFILKQARPWVEKYPHIAAPWERALVEGRFYETIAADAALAARMPKLIGLDAESHILALEDLGEAGDFTALYQGAALTDAELTELAGYLTRLHALPSDAAQRAAFANRAMRTLNHLHIFDFPLQLENGFDLDALTPGLNEAARPLKQDAAYVRLVRELGELYLQDGATLLHGDYFPGSWLRTARGVCVIDPEFCFYGPPEFDLGVLAAHLHLAGAADGVPRLFAQYRAPLDYALLWRFAGVEIMRRLIGVAQLPLALELPAKTALLRRAHALVLHPPGGIEA